MAQPISACILNVLVVFDKLANLIYFGNPILLRFFFRRRCTDRKSQKMELKNTPPLINLDKAYAKAQHRLFYGNCMESQGIPPGTEASLPDGGGGGGCGVSNADGHLLDHRICTMGGGGEGGGAVSM